MKIEKMTFNGFQENTYILYDHTNECVIVDPGCYTNTEEQQLFSFIDENNLTPVAIFNTHNHIDHVFGITAVRTNYNIPFYCHKGEVEGLQQVPNYAPMYGLQVATIEQPEFFIEEGKSLHFGETELEVLFTPGHSIASVCFYHQPSNQLIAGDVLFQNSIGRFDLPGGNYETLMQSIKNKLMVLPDETITYPGHGEHTTIGEERRNNPFILEWAQANK